MYLAYFKYTLQRTHLQGAFYVCILCPAHKYVCYGNYADEECCIQNNNAVNKVEKETCYLVKRQQL